MAVACSRLTQGGSSGNSPYQTATITPPADTVILATCVMGDSISNAMTISGCNLTWTKINSASADGTRVTTWWGKGTNPTSSKITFSHASAINAAWVVAKFTGASVTDPIRQSAINTANDSSLTMTLAAFGSGGNATVGACGMNSSSGVTMNPGSGFSEIGEGNSGDQSVCMLEFKATNDTSVDYSRTSGSGYLEGIGMEIVASANSASPSLSPSKSPSKSPSRSPSKSPSISPSASLSPSLSPSTSPSLSPSASLSPSVSPSLSPSLSPTLSASPSLSPSFSPSLSPSQSLSPSLSPSVSPSASLSPSTSPSLSPSISPSVSPSIGMLIPNHVKIKTFKHKSIIRNIKPRVKVI